MNRFWKSYAGFVGAGIIVSMGWHVAHFEPPSPIGFIANLLLFAAICGLAWERRLLKKHVWLVFFWLLIPSMLVVLALPVLVDGPPVELRVILFFWSATLLPGVYGVYLYAYKRESIWAGS